MSDADPGRQRQIVSEGVGECSRTSASLKAIICGAGVGRLVTRFAGTCQHISGTGGSNLWSGNAPQFQASINKIIPGPQINE